MRNFLVLLPKKLSLDLIVLNFFFGLLTNVLELESFTFISQNCPTSKCCKKMFPKMFSTFVSLTFFKVKDIDTHSVHQLQVIGTQGCLCLG